MKMEKIKKLLILLTLFFICYNTSYHTLAKPLYQLQDQIEHYIEQVKKEMMPLDFSKEPVHSPAAIAFFKYYGIHFENTRHFFGSFNSCNKIITSHIFLPSNPKGTVFLMHGYFDHTGVLKNLIRYCLSKQFAVAVYDLPGHGLSGGERSSINDFSEYVSVLGDFIRVCQNHLPEPFHLISHSTGSSIAFDYMCNTQEQVFTKIIFLAPLIHSKYWKLSKIGYHLTKLFFKNIWRKYCTTSSDSSFLEFVKKDPLQDKYVPLKFVKALYVWNKRIKNYKMLSKPILVIQGTLDNIVDWEYNIPFLKKRIKGIEIELIDNAKHHLLNESQAIQSKVLDTIGEYLERNEIWN